MAHLRLVIDMVNTDAASDEKRAMKLLNMETDVGDGGIDIQLPNLLIHNLDKTHASRRRHPIQGE